MQDSVAVTRAVEGHRVPPGQQPGVSSLQITLTTGFVCLLISTTALTCNAALEGWDAATFPNALPKEESVQLVKRATHEKKAGVNGAESTK